MLLEEGAQFVTLSAPVIDRAEGKAAIPDLLIEFGEQAQEIVVLRAEAEIYVLLDPHEQIHVAVRDERVFKCFLTVRILVLQQHNDDLEQALKSNRQTVEELEQ